MASVRKLTTHLREVSHFDYLFQRFDPTRLVHFEIRNPAERYRPPFPGNNANELEAVKHLLSNATGLLTLAIYDIYVVNEGVFRSISQLTKLRELILVGSSEAVSEKQVAILAGGPCWKSLQRITLVVNPSVNSEAYTRRIFERFGSCEVHIQSH